MDILGFLGSLFGQKKKQQPTTQSKPTATVARPIQAPVINTQQVQNTVRVPQPLIAPTQISTPSLGGITSTPNTGDDAQVQRIIQAGGAGAPASPAVIAAAKAAPVRPTVQAPQKSLLSAVQDFTAQANDELYGGLIKGGANIANSFATGFNQDETAKRTADFARTLGIDTGNGQSQTAAGTDRNSNAGQLGQAVGQVEKTVAENAPFIIAPGLGATAALPTRIAGGVATGVPTAFLQGAANNGSLQDDATSGIIGGAAGAALTGVAPLLGKAAGRILNRADNVSVKSAGPITSSPTTNKAPAITSPNREAAAAATIRQPAVVAPQETGIPSFNAPVVEKPPVQIAPTPFDEPAALTSQPIAAPVAQAPALSTSELGSITRNAVRDGSINTPEGLDATIAKTTQAAHEAADSAGTTLDKIIQKGQKVWETNKSASPAEASKIVPSFTTEEQNIYKSYSQELGTLRDRSGHSLTGGDQGAWYGPRQFLDDAGASREFDPSLVNELRRTGASTDSAGNGIDYSATPYEQYIRRYADAPNAGSQRIVDAAENKVTTNSKGESTVTPTGVKVPDEAKANLETNLKAITEKRDKIDQLAAGGDTEGAKALQKEVSSDTNKAFNDFIDSIPGSGKARREAIESVKAMRGQYEQTLAQTLTLSNVVNRSADQGTKAVEIAKRPLVQGLKKVFAKAYAGKVMSGTEAPALNTSKEAVKAARKFASGTLGREVIDNAKATISQAGAGRNLAVKTIAKTDASVRASGGALVQSADLSTQNVSEALQIGASRPEAAGLKTADDYTKYFNDYTKTQKFQEDLAVIEAQQNPKIGLAGGEVQKNGNISNFLSKEVDNFIKTNANRIKPGLGDKRLVNEVNDLFKGNVTGYAGVTTRVLGTLMDAAVPVRPLLRAAKQAASGSEAAVAQAATTAAHATADTIALYGTAGAAALLTKTGVIGYTGAGGQYGSSQSAYDKANNVPENQFFINLPGNKRVYFDPARPLGAVGAGADIAGSVASGGNTGSTALNVVTQLANQAGGSSLPQNIVNAQTVADPKSTDSDKKYASAQLQSLAAPSTGIFNNIANFTDPTKRAPTNFVDDLKSNIPVLRSQTPAAKDSQGNTIANSKQVSGGSSLFSVANGSGTTPTGKTDPVAAETDRLQGLYGDVFPTNANTNASKNKSVQSYANLLLNDPLYKSADDDGKHDLLKNVLSGTNTKDINSSLSDTDKQALLDVKILGDKKTAWLDDNTNNANYQTAVFNNAKASGKLTNADKDLSNPKGLQYKAVSAQVDKDYNADYELKNNYGDTSQSEFNSLLNSKSDTYDPDVATKLYDYDQARVKAGLPPKYNLAKAQKTGAYAAKGKGGSGDNFTFASLPSSLIGNSDGSSKYAEASALFKPIADLQTPRAAAVPERRTISVKKGIVV